MGKKFRVVPSGTRVGSILLSVLCASKITKPCSRVAVQVRK